MTPTGCPRDRHHEDSARLANLLRPQYLRVRVLADSTVAALHDLIFTRAILLDCDELGFGRRFCFGNRHLAERRFDELQSCDDEPAGYVARRGVQ